MGKKNKSRGEHEENLEKENRELRQVNRSLLRQIKKLSRGTIKEESKEEESREDDIRESKSKNEKPINDKCPVCNSGELIFIPIGVRILERCVKCDYRKTKKA